MNEIINFYGQNWWFLWLPLVFIIGGLIMSTKSGARWIIYTNAITQGIKPHITKEGIDTYRFYGVLAIIFGIIILLGPYLKTLI